MLQRINLNFTPIKILKTYLDLFDVYFESFESKFSIEIPKSNLSINYLQNMLEKILTKVESQIYLNYLIS